MEPSDIQVYYSGGATNDDPDLSLGGVISSELIPDDTLANLFDNVTAGERLSGTVEYRCFYFLNNDNDESLGEAGVYIQSNTPSDGTDIAIAIDPAGINGTAVTIASEDNAPAGVDFDSVSPLPTSYETSLSIGSPSTLGPGDYIAVWVRRTVNAATDAAASDPFTIRIEGVPES